MDCVRVQQLQCYGYHGVFPEENRLGQRFIVDLALDVDLRKAGKHDDMMATVNYAELTDKVQQLVGGRPFQLVEAVAEAIAALILHDFPLVQTAHVTVTKPHPPVAVHFAGVAITIHRTREQ